MRVGLKNPSQSFFFLFSHSVFHHSELNTEDYKCPVLKGCTVCVTGLSTVERKEVQRLCEQNGGTYTGQLKMNECTHLVVSEPTGDPIISDLISMFWDTVLACSSLHFMCCISGQKYEFARKWNVYCVSMHWLFDSIEKGFCQDESRYAVECGKKRAEEKPGRPNTSTPTGPNRSKEGE